MRWQEAIWTFEVVKKKYIALGQRSLVTHRDCQSLKKERNDQECGLTGPACPRGADRTQWSMGKDWLGLAILISHRLMRQNLKTRGEGARRLGNQFTKRSLITNLKNSGFILKMIWGQ